MSHIDPNNLKKASSSGKTIGALKLLSKLNYIDENTEPFHIVYESISVTY